MSQADVDAFRGAFDAFTRGDAGWTDLLDENVTWDISKHPLPDWPTTGSGRDELVAYFGAYRSSWTDYRSELREVLNAKDQLVVVAHETVRVPGSDAELERDLVQVWTVRDGRALHLSVYPNREQALVAVGLRE